MDCASRQILAVRPSAFLAAQAFGESRTIARDLGGQNGVISYTHDPVWNRTQQTSIVPPMVSGSRSYEAIDRFTADDCYDANGTPLLDVAVVVEAARVAPHAGDDGMQGA